MDARRLAAARVTVTTGCSGLPFPGSEPVVDGLTLLAGADGWSASLETRTFFDGDPLAGPVTTWPAR